jgi:acetyl-CoA carboxylase biotin carboxyl carrier protein
MTNEEIKELLKIFIESGVAEMDVQRGDNRLRVRRANVSQEYVMMAPPAGLTAYPPPYPSAQPSQPSAQPLAKPPAEAAAASAKAAEAGSGQVLVKSPIVGTYYDAPAPGSQPFVRVGDAVEPGQVLCIIESMKLMNEIESEVAGVVVAKLMENGRAVEYGEALFTIHPR